MSKSINISFYLEVGEFWVNEADSEFGVVYTQNNASSGFKNFQYIMLVFCIKNALYNRLHPSYGFSTHHYPLKNSIFQNLILENNHGLTFFRKSQFLKTDTFLFKLTVFIKITFKAEYFMKNLCKSYSISSIERFVVFVWLIFCQIRSILRDRACCWVHLDCFHSKEQVLKVHWYCLLSR